MRYLGIDFGTKRVGLALSDESGAMGFPYAIYPNNGLLIDEIQKLIAQKDVKVVIIGKSEDFEGNDNPVAKKAKEFAYLLERLSGITIEWEPEMYTTQEARRDFEGVRTTTHELVDASAAALILTSYLSRISPKQLDPPETEE